MQNKLNLIFQSKRREKLDKTRVLLRKKNHLREIKKLFRNDFFVSYNNKENHTK